MKALPATVLIALPGLAWGQRVLEFRHDFAFSAREVNGLRRDYADIDREPSQNFSVMLRMQPIYVQQELEADYIGFILGAEAGFRPKAMISLLKKLGDGGASLVATHPTEARRPAQARSMLESARRLYARALK